MNRYERREGLMSVRFNEAVAGYRAISEGERLTVNGGGMSGTFTVDTVSEPDENGAITLTLTEIR